MDAISVKFSRGTNITNVKNYTINFGEKCTEDNTVDKSMYKGMEANYTNKHYDTFRTKWYWPKPPSFDSNKCYES